ncbi:MAG: nitroreductase family protein [Bacteroides sp.]|nr:nitroreductase family protein [Bacteroides sp.]MCM1413104.1 nitroreductase family protein [Bacteroides sp.]MCM1472154.1 nitroreductase family protein [Bacteroides sp.]
MTLQDLTVNPQILIDNIISRTSIREYDSSRRIPNTVVTQLLHAAMAAPSAVDRRPWAFVYVDRRETLNALAAQLPYAKMTSSAPAAIVCCGDTTRFLEGIDSTLWVQDLSAASENILLAAHAEGLGAVWTSVYPHADRIRAVTEILNLPFEIIPFNVIPIGYPLRPHTPREKWDSTRVHHNKW